MRLFSDDGAFINLLNINREKVIRGAGIKGQCFKDYFYGRESQMEHALGHVEGAGLGVIRRMLRQQCTPPYGHGDRGDLMFYLCVQQQRTAYVADAMNDAMDVMMKRILHRTKDVPLDDLAKVKINFREPGVFAVSLAGMNFWLLGDLGWRLVRFDTKASLLTSDHPSILYNQLMEHIGPTTSTGLACKGLQYYLPIGPKHCLLLYDRTCYRVSCSHEHGLHVSTEERDIEQLNRLQLVSARDNVYFGADVENVEEQFVNAKPLRRQALNRHMIVPMPKEGNRMSELIGHSRIDVQTKLHLSFVHVTTKAKQWRHTYLKLRMRPAIVIRNPKLCAYHDDFCKLLKEGGSTSQWNALDFMKYCEWRDENGPPPRVPHPEVLYRSALR